MHFDADRVRDNARRADTADLLNRVTIFRHDLDAQAYPIIMQELRARGITPDDVINHEQHQPEPIIHPAGHVRYCSFCHDPAETTGRGWFKMLGRIPIFPRTVYYCRQHRPSEIPVKPEAEET